MTRHLTLPHVLRPLAVLGILALLAAPGAARDKKVKPGELSGTVMGQDEKVLEGIQVTATDLSTGDVAGRTETNRKGRFEIRIDAPTGRYKLSLVGEGWDPFEAELDLGPGEAQDTQIKLIDIAAGQRNRARDAYNEGAAAHTADELETALGKFQESAKLDPSLAAPWLGLADIHLRQGASAEAVTAIETYRRLDPDNEQGKRLAVAIYRAADMTDKARGLAAELGDTNLDRDLAVQTYNEGALASQGGDYETALAKFSEAAELDPSLAEAHSGAASVLYNQEKYGEALAAADRAIALDAASAQGLRMRFLVLDAQANPDAATAWSAYHGVAPEAALDLRYRRAELDFRDGNNDAAKAALQAILEAKPDMARAHYTLGLIYSSTDAAKAKEHLGKFIEMAPDDPEVEAAKEILAYL